jgi:hypothetical protein
MAENKPNRSLPIGSKPPRKDRLTKAAMAAPMQTNRPALDRLLDPKNTAVTLHTLQRAAEAVRRHLRLELT